MYGSLIKIIHSEINILKIIKLALLVNKKKLR